MNRAARQGESALETPHAWRELTCQEYEDAIRADDEAHVASSITDPDGVYGSPLTFTLWLMSDGSYLSTALEGRRDTEDYKCSHAASVPVLETRIVNAIGGNEVNTSAYNTVEPVKRVTEQ